MFVRVSLKAVWCLTKLGKAKFRLDDLQIIGKAIPTLLFTECDSEMRQVSFLRV